MTYERYFAAEKAERKKQRYKNNEIKLELFLKTIYFIKGISVAVSIYHILIFLSYNFLSVHIFSI